MGSGGLKQLDDYGHIRAVELGRLRRNNRRAYIHIVAGVALVVAFISIGLAIMD